MIIARLIPRNLTVQVTNVFTTSDGRKLASVTALAGKPFTSWSHGGWVESDWAAVPVTSLADVAISADFPPFVSVETIVAEQER